MMAFLRIIFVRSANLDDGREPAATALGHVDVEALTDFVDRRLDGRGARQTHQGLMLGFARNQGVEDGMIVAGERHRRFQSQAPDEHRPRYQ